MGGNTHLWIKATVENAMDEHEGILHRHTIFQTMRSCSEGRDHDGWIGEGWHYYSSFRIWIHIIQLLLAHAWFYEDTRNSAKSCLPFLDDDISLSFAVACVDCWPSRTFSSFLLGESCSKKTIIVGKSIDLKVISWFFFRQSFVVVLS